MTDPGASASSAHSDDRETIPDEAMAVSAPSLQPGQLLGRYVTLERIGSGGMGVVWSAFDPELDRRVAIKILRPDRLSSSGPEVARTRLMREAQAMARLTHPNVVAVHDVGTVDERIFVAMDYVPGGTLKSFVRSKPGWERLLTAFREAGAGLAAAHRAGMVHRDFKPENVLLDEEGRARVMDFGLATADRSGTATGEHPINEPVDEVEDTLGDATGDAMRASQAGRRPATTSASFDAFSVSVTRMGAMMGTPAYMSPEQHLGNIADARSDQYSFCAALYEALYGRLPHEGETLIELSQHVIEDPVTRPRDSEAPAWVFEIIERGLRKDPEQRYSSMDDLLADLSKDPGAARRRWIGLAASAVVLVSATWFVSSSTSDEDAESALCTGAGERIESVWNDDARLQVREGIRAGGSPHARADAEVVERIFDDWTSRWSAGYADNCRATQILGEQSEATMDKRNSCLGRRLDELEARIGLLVEGHDAGEGHAVDLATTLEGPEVCARVDSLMNLVPLPADAKLRQQIAEAYVVLAEGSALRDAGDYPGAAEKLDPLLERTRKLDYAPLLADVLHARGGLALRMAKPDDARTLMTESAWLAYGAGDDALAAESFAKLVSITGKELGDDEAWRPWEKASRAALARAGDARLAEIHLSNAIGLVHGHNGRYEEALAAHLKTKKLIEAYPPALLNELPSVENNIGTVLRTLGRHEEAVNHLERGVALEESSRGSHHPGVGVASGNLGHALLALGRYDEAERSYRRALSIAEGALDPKHPDVAAAHDNLGTLFDARGDRQAALEHLERALEIRERHDGPDSLRVAVSLNNLGDTLMAIGDLERADPIVRRALVLFEKHHGPEHPFVGVALNNVGKLSRLQGDYVGAMAALDRAQQIHESSLGPKHPFVAYHLTEKGEVHLDRKAPRRAVPLLERALAIRLESEPEPDLLAETRFALARALESADPARARSLAREALADRERAGGDGEAKLRIEAWIAEHPETAEAAG